MPDSTRGSSNDSTTLDQRCERLESRYAHLERVVETLNEVVIEQGKRIALLERQVALLTHQWQAVAETGPEPRSLEDDKPPHY
ncbi:MAG: SlyX family protein [Pirellulales bacterium]